ncbi:MAG: hypothetical protein AB7I30_08585 [Isosphaeraceae bacterium]
MTKRLHILTIVVLLASHARAADPPPPPVFKVGFATRDITPDLGMEAPGGYGKAYHRTFHDPCKVRASVFDDGASRVAVVGIDALGIRRETVLKVREAIEASTGIPAASILIGASHSHSSGPIVWTMPGEYDHASDLVKSLAYDQSTNVDMKYLERVENALVEAVREADARRTQAIAGAGKGIESTVAFNRRFLMKHGGAVTHPGLGNPETVEPAGPVDPEVGVIGVWDAKKPGELLGCVVNFACHATTSPGGISANYIYYLEKVIQGYYGKDAVVVFLAGASGDVTQVDNQSPFVNPPPERWAQLVGGKVGAEALKVLLTVEPGTLTPLASKSKVWMIPRRVPDPDRVNAALATVQGDRSKVDPAEWTFAKETVLLDALIRKSPEVEVEVQALQIGPVVLVSDPAEYFCRFGLEIKERSGFPLTFPVSLANGCVGYVPTEDAFGPAGGGYETRLTSYSNLVIDAGTQMRDVGIELARQLKPGKSPEPPRHPPFTGKPWSYGDVRPQLK